MQVMTNEEKRAARRWLRMQGLSVTSIASGRYDMHEFALVQAWSPEQAARVRQVLQDPAVSYRVVREEFVAARTSRITPVTRWYVAGPIPNN